MLPQFAELMRFSRFPGIELIMISFKLKKAVVEILRLASLAFVKTLLVYPLERFVVIGLRRRTN